MPGRRRLHHAFVAAESLVRLPTDQEDDLATLERCQEAGRRFGRALPFADIPMPKGERSLLRSPVRVDTITRAIDEHWVPVISAPSTARPNIGIAIFDARADIEHLGPGGDNGAGPCLRASPHDGPASLVSGCVTLRCGHTGCVPVPRRWFGRPVSRWESGFALVGRVLTRRARGCRACASFRHEGPALASGCRAAS